ncbi:hypothetical protein AB0A95_18675 [Micromonospora sp. NPDC049230]|uniref:hypothetical protein n=1 Tax=Micromonospora sp. NPDC049230 TaxID=3155502 RepID=UPI0033F0EB44
MRRRWIFPIVLVTVLATAGVGTTSALASSTTRDHELVARLQKLLPDDHRLRPELRYPFAIDPGDYECVEDGPMSQWKNSLTAGMTPDQLAGFSTLLSYNVWESDALYFPQPERQRYFGRHGEYTSQMRAEWADLKKFWDVRSDAVQMVPVHGDVILDQARSARAIRAGLGLSPRDAAEAAVMLKELADQDVYQHGELPLFTALNSMTSFSPDNPAPPGTDARPKILYGDGVFSFGKTFGYDRIGPKIFLAHEYGHQVQTEHGLMPAKTTPEQSRRLELMADSMGTYFLGHRRGENLPWPQLRRSTEFLYRNGDCRFTSRFHHGTLNQRGRAGEWGAKLSQAGGRILPSGRMIELFDRKLPQIVAPDAPETVTLSAAELSAVS